MSMHTVDFEYDLPEWGSMQVDLDPDLDRDEKEEIALVEIKELYEDIKNINITKMVPTQ